MAVEPVKEILATSGSVQRTPPTAGVFSLEQGTTLKTPGGIPACSASYHPGQRGEEKETGENVVEPPEVTNDSPRKQAAHVVRSSLSELM